MRVAENKWALRPFKYCLSSVIAVVIFGKFLLSLSASELARNPPDGVSVGLVDDSNMFKWEVRHSNT